MPYKDKKKSRAAYRKWYARNKEKAAIRKKIEWVTRKKHPIIKVCSIKGCNNQGERHHPNYSEPEKIIWLCKIHHCQVHSKKCRVVWCNNKHLALGLCQKHYSRRRRKKL